MPTVNTTHPDAKQTHNDTQATPNTCNECGGTIQTNGDEHICNSCGLVIEEHNIDHGPEWRACNDTDTEQKRRVGAPLTNLQHDNGLSTNIGSLKRDGYGNTLSSEQRMKMTRLQKLNKRYKTKNAKERNLQQALNEIQRMASALGLTKPVQETASQLYRECLRKDMLPGRSIEGMSSACLYIASRICNSPRTLDDFRPVSLVSTPATGKNGGCEIERAYRYISKELDIAITPPDPRQYVNRLLNALEVNNKQQLRTTAITMIETAEEANIHSGRAPMSIAASAVYIACGMHEEHISQPELADIAELSPTTIRARYQEIITEHKNIDSPQHMFNHVALQNNTHEQ
jgi:transcription initiation factor TFIIB